MTGEEPPALRRVRARVTEEWAQVGCTCCMAAYPAVIIACRAELASCRHTDRPVL